MLADVLAELLPRWSLDLINLTISFLIFNVPQVRAQPLHLFTVKLCYPGGCLAVAFSPRWEIWVGDAKGIAIFTTEGVLLREAHYSIGECRSIAFDQAEAYVSQEDGIVVCRLDGSLERVFKATGGWPFQHPVLAFDDVSQRLIVCSPPRVFLFHKSGVLENWFFCAPAEERSSAFIRGGIAVHAQHLWMTSFNRGARTVVVFDITTGQLLRTFRTNTLSGIAGVALDRNCEFLVMDDAQWHVRVMKTDAQLTELASFGQTSRRPEYQFQPNCMCIDAMNRIIVGDWNMSVQVFGFV